MAKIRKGKYKHYKGNVYEIIGIGFDSETLEEVVVYRGLYDSREFGSRPIFVRPLKMFMEKVTVQGKQMPRFTFLGD